jgi:hypothetical protein
MSKGGNYNYSLLYKDAEREKTVKTIDNIKQHWEKFEKGAMKPAEFKAIIENEGIELNPKVEKLIEAPNSSLKTFAAVLQNLNLLQKKEGYNIKEKRNPYYSNTHARYKKKLNDPKSLEDETDPNLTIKKISQQLLKRTINTDQYIEKLRENNINPNIEEINKFLRKHEAGNLVKFTDLYGSVIKYRSSTNDPTKVEYDIPPQNFHIEHSEDSNGARPMVSANPHNAQLCFFTKKKNLRVGFNSYNSNKETFDWELNHLKMLKNGELEPSQTSKNDPRHKIVFESKVFEKDIPGLKESKNHNRASTSHFAGSGDIFNWKGSISNNNDNSPKKEIKRKNPNEQATASDEIKPRQVKENKMMASSHENVLNNNKVR